MKPYPFDTTSDMPEQLTNFEREQRIKHGARVLARLEASMPAVTSHKDEQIAKALKNFVEAIEAYRETGVWPDNGTLRQLADEGLAALNS